MWRTKWHRDPLKENLILCACMHGGTAVYDISMSDKIEGDESALNPPIVVSSCKEIVRFPSVATPKQLAYGADWLCEKDGAELSFVTSSFYENTMDTVCVQVQERAS